MISGTPTVSVRDLAETTGWEVKPQGACKGVRCVPLPASASEGELVDLRAFAETMQMPLLHDEVEGLWSLGPEAGGSAMASAKAPDLVLPTLEGEPFELARLRGRKVLIAAWASW